MTDGLLPVTDAAFVAEIRAFLATAFTPELRAAADRQTSFIAEPALAAQWQRILFEKGWVAPAWPVDYGGPGWTPWQRLLFDHECALANTPILPTMGLQLCGPMVISHGTEEQKAYFLPRILSGEHMWCQGYSEPGAGSDLASLKTRAVRDGDFYVINGTKIWTTLAHVANWMFVLVRTNGKVRPQAGITFLLVPMDTPGITVTPIRSMSGDHEVNQVFFDDVRVPAANRLGEENDGWTVAKSLLEHERGGMLATARTVRMIGMIRRLADTQGGLPPELHRQLITLEIEVEATAWTQRRMIMSQGAVDTVGNSNASILKLKASEMYQEACMLYLDALGIWGLPDQQPALEGLAEPIGPLAAESGAARYMNSRAMSIFGGTSEVQRTILAKSALGL
jgi:acyl-CoA dehydrogenase